MQNLTCNFNLVESQLGGMQFIAEFISLTSRYGDNSSLTAASDPINSRL